MTLPKGFGSSGAGGASSSDVERMIGKRVENMTGMITLSYIAAWLATFGGTAAGYFYYPWAYPTNSGHYAFIVLTYCDMITVPTAVAPITAAIIPLLFFLEPSSITLTQKR